MKASGRNALSCSIGVRPRYAPSALAAVKGAPSGIGATLLP